MVTKRKKFIFEVVAVLVFSSACSVFASPYFAISGDQWQDALDANEIAGLGASDFAEIMAMWADPNEGDPYPSNTYYPPELYTYTPYPQISASPTVRFNAAANGTIDFKDFAAFALEWLKPVYDYSELVSPGLVMAWGPGEQSPYDSWSSGWEFTYGEDPDLSNVTITASVDPPGDIDTISLGLKDINGNIMAWQWSVPNPIPRDGYTLISINTARNGVNAANPVASGYTVSPGFDITQVVSIFATENSRGRTGIRNLPPPNQTVAKPWNYWKDLIIVPNRPAPGDLFYKWRQPIQFIKNRGNIWGWDEVSVDSNQPLLADDWCCTDDRPVTDIHWWGSFPNRDPNLPGWMAPFAPTYPIAPSAFHIGIWTDTPGDPNGQDLTRYSHPNQMIFEQYVGYYNYDVNFVGYDKDPRDPNTPVRDACFKFSCILDPNFVQDPHSNRIYWLSIAAVFDTNEPEYLWGWKTRPHYYNDDAVRITAIQGGGWPPTLGSIYQSGQPLECPEYCSWDLAFELTTDVNDPNSCPCFRR